MWGVGWECLQAVFGILSRLIVLPPGSSKSEVKPLCLPKKKKGTQALKIQRDRLRVGAPGKGRETTFVSTESAYKYLSATIKKKSCWDFDRDTIESTNQSWQNRHFNDTESSDSWTLCISTFIYIYLLWLLSAVICGFGIHSLYPSC